MSLQTTWIAYGARGQFSGYLATPAAGTGSLPAVIVVQEIWGVDAHIQSVAERFAMAGYTAFAPDLYALNGERPEPLKAERLEAVKAFMDALPPGTWGNPEARAQALATKPEPVRKELEESLAAIFQHDIPGYLESLTAAAAYLREEEPTSKGQRIAVVGFCLGGRLAAQLACLDPQLGGAVIFYGNAPQLEQIATIACPVIGFYGGDDKRITDEVPSFAEAMAAAGKSFTPHIYAGVPHAFFNDTRPSYRADASRDAFARTLAFLNEQLS